MEAEFYKDMPPLLNVSPVAPPAYDLVTALMAAPTWLDTTKDHIKTIVVAKVNGDEGMEVVRTHLATSLLELSNQLSSADFRELLLKDIMVVLAK